MIRQILLAAIASLALAGSAAAQFSGYPPSGNLQFGQGSAAPPAWNPLNGDCTSNSIGAIVCSKTNGVTFYTGLPTPVNPADAATKSYVDSVAIGLDIHTQVAWATTAALPNTPTYANGSSGVGATLTAGSDAAIAVDGGSPVMGDRVLVKEQASGFQNGVYTVTTVGSGSAPWVLTRATDFNTVTAGNVAAGAYFFVYEGTTNIGSSWVFTTPPTITIGTTALTFVQYANAGMGPWQVSGSNTYYNAGNVGIGTSSPATPLDVHGGPISIGGTKQYYTPQMYNPNCGTAGQDCTAALTSCLGTDYCFLPCGTYDTTGSTGTTNSNGVFWGAGHCSIVRGTAASTDIIQFGTSSGRTGLSIHDIAFTTSLTRTTNWVLEIDDCTTCYLSNIWMDSVGCSSSSCTYELFGGIAIPNAEWVTIRNFTLNFCQYQGLLTWNSIISVEGPTSYINHCESGIVIAGGSAGYFNINVLSSTGDGVLVNTAGTSNKNSQLFFGENGDLDSNGGDGLHVIADSIMPGGTSGIVFKGWSASNTDLGINIENQGGIWVQIVGAEILNNVQGGIYLQDASGYFIMTNSLVILNGQPNGYGLVGSGITPASQIITGNSIVNNGSGAIANFTASGTIRICTGNSVTGPSSC